MELYKILNVLVQRKCTSSPISPAVLDFVRDKHDIPRIEYLNREQLIRIRVCILTKTQISQGLLYNVMNVYISAIEVMQIFEQE